MPSADCPCCQPGFKYVYSRRPDPSTYDLRSDTQDGFHREWLQDTPLSIDATVNLVDAIGNAALAEMNNGNIAVVSAFPSSGHRVASVSADGENLWVDDGSLTFSSSSGPRCSVCILEDGSIVAGFGNSNGQGGVARLLEDGTMVNDGIWPSSALTGSYSLAYRDGKLFIHGQLPGFVSGGHRLSVVDPESLASFAQITTGSNYDLARGVIPTYDLGLICAAKTNTLITSVALQRRRPDLSIMWSIALTPTFQGVRGNRLLLLSEESSGPNATYLIAYVWLSAQIGGLATYRVSIMTVESDEDAATPTATIASVVESGNIFVVNDVCATGDAIYLCTGMPTSLSQKQVVHMNFDGTVDGGYDYGTRTSTVTGGRRPMAITTLERGSIVTFGHLMGTASAP